MDLSTLIDGPSALIVGGGTLLATVLRSGLGDCRMTLRKLAGLGRNGFDLDHTARNWHCRFRRSGRMACCAPCRIIRATPNSMMLPMP